MKNKLTKEQIEEIMDFCDKNNMIEFKNSKLKLGITDGGYVNLIKLKDFLELKR
jgi:hypothetical protein